MNITVNGKVFSVEPDITLEKFIRDSGKDPAKTVAAVNGCIVSGEDCPGTILKDRDVLDLMSFVGGG
ncbi:MAG: sulfur carrier protein ThiS [Victivallaceae bacterium]